MSNQIIVTHGKDVCEPPCPFHAPSDHPLNKAKIHMRPDKGFLVERICEHGLGHDDPDSVAYMHKHGHNWAGVHGCDGCCTGTELTDWGLSIKGGIMAKYRKKPVVIEAFKWGTDKVPQWWVDLEGTTIQPSSGSAFIPTLEGTMEARVGDYIIQGVQGEVYPCKPEIFMETYELVEDEPDEKRLVFVTYSTHDCDGNVLLI